MARLAAALVLLFPCAAAFPTNPPLTAAGPRVRGNAASTSGPDLSRSAEVTSVRVGGKLTGSGSAAPTGSKRSTHQAAQPFLSQVASPPTRRTQRANRSLNRVPLIGGPVHYQHSKPYSVFTDAPHTHAGLVAWSKMLRWPWPQIIRCEALNDDSWEPSSSSHARGILQFLPSTWRSLGLTGDPAAASWRDQLAAAERLRARDGLGAWSCAHILGIA